MNNLDAITMLLKVLSFETFGGTRALLPRYLSLGRTCY